MHKKTIENIKTTAIIVLSLIIVFGASYCASELKSCKSGKTNTTTTTNNNDNVNSDSTSDIPESEQKELNEINISKYLSLKEGEDKAIIYISRPTCHYCEQQDPIIKNIVYEYGITVNYLNTDELDDEGQTKLIKSDDYFSEGYGTPLTLIVQNGKIIAKKEGLTAKDNLVSFFKDQGFINE